MTCSICPPTRACCSSCYTGMFLGLILPIFSPMFCVHIFSKTTNSDTVCQLAINSLIVAVSIHSTWNQGNLRRFMDMYYREILVIGWFIFVLLCLHNNCCVQLYPSRWVITTTLCKYLSKMRGEGACSMVGVWYLIYDMYISALGISVYLKECQFVIAPSPGSPALLHADIKTCNVVKT